jgi:hypothetical protein
MQGTSKEKLKCPPTKNDLPFSKCPTNIKGKITWGKVLFGFINKI